ncbi:MAG: PAS domain S-box protein [Bacteroidota bacterium]
MPGTEHIDQRPHKNLEFIYLPKYATYLLNHKIREFTKEQLDTMFKVDFPILKYYDLSIYTEQQLIDLSIPAYSDFLNAAIENKLNDFITDSLKKWVADQLPNITRDQLVIDDISLATYVRKKALVTFISGYTSDINLAMELVKEIDDYGLEAESRSFRTYINIHNEKIKEINDTLKKHEADLLEAQEMASLGSFEWDLTGINSTFTPQVFKIFEMQKSSNLEDFLNYVHPGDRTKLQESIIKALNGEDHYECEYRYRRNGKEKVLWTKGIVTFKDNKPHFMKGTVMDITDRHYILKRLERNEELYKQSQKLTHIGNWTWELDTGEIKFSDELCRIYGLQPGHDINFEAFIAFVHPDDKTLVNERLQYSAKTGKAHAIDFRIVRQDSSIRTIRRIVEVLVDETGIPYKIYGTGQDITKEVLLNKEVKEREANYSQLIENAPDGIIVIDEHNKILLWNPKTTDIFGWNSKDTIGKDLGDTIIPERYREQHMRGMSRLLATGKPVLLNKTIEVIAINKQKKEFHISLTVSQSVQKGRPVFIAFIRDMSDEKNIKSELELKTNQLAELNLSLEQKNIALERSNKELTSFSYVASHDLQEPLRKIKTFSNLILEKEKDLTKEGMECFERIIVSAGRMQKLIEDLLSFSRTQLYENTLKPVDLNEVLTDVKTLHAESMAEGRLSIESDKLPTVLGVPFQLQQLFENIISNSMKYSKPKQGAKIKVSSELISAQEIPFFNTHGFENYYRISLSDNGIGFDQKYADKIFEIFQRLHGKNEYSGTGIGLSICKRIVENHQGYIAAHSILDKGATFEVYLPVGNY